ncbi:MAG: hypothetical protein CVU87_13050 [Firmicutes bacterium HGW-Firmicutes-12]|nr:MAG: hypothetical protein CVU87_13050 [Firmicutes bacterium HGW-Firmicutes-12]
MELPLLADSVVESSSYNCIIRGRVRGPVGNPLADMVIYTYPTPWNGETPLGALSDQEGNYLISGLAPGNYKLGFGVGEEETGFLPEWFNNIRAWREAEVITILPGNDYEADAVMDRSTIVYEEPSYGIIRGRATRINEENGLEDALVGISVYAFRVEGGGLKVPIKALTSTDGTYEIRDLIPGSYKIEFAPEVVREGKTLVAWYDNVRTWREADTVVIAPGDSFLVNYVME